MTAVAAYRAARRVYRAARRLSPTMRLRTIGRIAQMADDDTDRASIERIGLLTLDLTPGAAVAALWEAQALGEHSETPGIVGSSVGDVVCRWP